MLYYGGYDLTSLLFMLPGVLLATWAQAKVSGNFNKYSRVQSAHCITGAEAARKILNDNGLSYVAIQHISETLGDHYDPGSKVIRLSDEVFNSTSLAAVAVAAHECGHAIQDAEEYRPMRWRSAIAPAASFATQAAWSILVAGLILSMFGMALAGALLFVVVVLFQLVTLPVEYNASARALTLLEAEGILESGEVGGAKKVLSAAALTYVASLAAAIFSFLGIIRMMLMYRRNRW